MSDSPREALEGLIVHPGWQAFVQHVTQEWGPNGHRYQTELDKALDLTDSAAAASQARQIRAARRMVETLLGWPAEEVARLTRQDEGPVLSMARGGYHR